MRGRLFSIKTGSFSLLEIFKCPFYSEIKFLRIETSPIDWILNIDLHLISPSAINNSIPPPHESQMA